MKVNNSPQTTKNNIDKKNIDTDSKKVFVLDDGDSEGIINQASKILGNKYEFYGHDCEKSKDAEEALKAINLIKPDVIITSYHMPGHPTKGALVTKLVQNNPESKVIVKTYNWASMNDWKNRWLGAKTCEGEQRATRFVHDMDYNYFRYLLSSIKKGDPLPVYAFPKEKLDKIYKNNEYEKSANRFIENFKNSLGDEQERMVSLAPEVLNCKDFIKLFKSHNLSSQIKLSLLSSVYDLPKEERLQAFENILNSLDGKNPEFDNKVKVNLVDNIYFLPEDKRLQVFENIFNSLNGKNPEFENKIKAVLATKICYLPENKKSEVFEAILNSLDGKNPEYENKVKAVLAAKICYLPEKELEAFKAILNSLDGKNPEYDEEIRAFLASRLNSLPEEKRSQAFKIIFDGLNTMDPYYKGVTKQWLANHIPYLPEGKRLGAFNNILNSLDCDNPGEKRAEMFLAIRINSLAENKRFKAFKAVLNSIDSKNPEYNDQIKSKLLRSINYLPEDKKDEAKKLLETHV